MKITICAALVFLAVAASGRAATFTWTNLVAGAANGSWSVGANWTPAGPAAGVNNTAQFTLPVTNSATLTLDGSATIGNLFFGNTATNAIGWTINAGTPSTSSLTLSVSSGTPAVTITNQSATLGAALAGTQGFTLSGGVLNLNTADTYTGLTTVNAGALVLNNLNAIAAGNSVNIASGAVVQPKSAGTFANVTTTLNGSSRANGSFGGSLDFHGGTATTWPGQIILNSATATIGCYGVTCVTTLSGQLTGSGSLTIRPEGGSASGHTATFTLSNPTNNYAGSTKMQVGTAQLSATLKLGVNNALPVTTALTLDRAGNSGVVYFDLAGYNQTLAGLTADFGSNAVINSSGTVSTLTISNSADTTFTGSIGASGKAGINLVKQGAANLTLSGTNLYTGVTTIGGAGELIGVTGGSAANSAANLASATATCGVSITDNTESWTYASLTTSAGGVLDFDFGAVAPGTSLAPLQISGLAAFTAQPAVTVECSNLTLGTHPLMTWGSVSGAVPVAVTAALPLGLTGTLSVSNTTLYLVIASNVSPISPPPNNIIAADNFDSYAPGSTLAGQGGAGWGWAGGWTAGAAGSVTATASANSVFSVPANGGLIGGNGSVAIGGTGSGVPLVRQLSTPLTNTFYAGMVMQWAGTLNTGDSAALFLTDNATDVANGFNLGLAGVWFQYGNVVRHGTGTAVTGAYQGLTGMLDVTYLVVKVEKTTGGNFNKITGWINPGTTSESTNPNGDVQLVTDSGLASISTLLLQAQNLDSGDGMKVDGLALAKTFAALMTPAGPGPDSRPLVPLIQVESAPDGSANGPVPWQTIASGQSITNYAIARAANGGFLSNTPAAWQLTNVTGGILNRDLVVSADGKSAVFTGNGAGSAQILAVGNATALMPSSYITVTSRTNGYARPFIWARLSDRDAILAKVRNFGWAAAQYEILRARTDSEQASYQANPNSYLRRLPLDTSTGVPKFTQTTTSATDGTVQNVFNAGVDCAAMYYLTGGKQYAKCGADILHNAIQGLVNVTPSANGWILSDGLLGEGPALGTQLPVIYDFLYDYLSSTNLLFQLQTAGGTNVAFSFGDAQTVFLTYYQLMRDNSQAGDNWSAAMAGCLVHNVLALDNAVTRSNSLQTYLAADAPNFSSLSTMAAAYTNPGTIWHEPLSYSQVVNTTHPYLMTMLEHYDPTLNLFATYTNVVTSMSRTFQFIYPNAVQIHFGDFHYDSGYDIPYFEYEMAYQRALQLNLPALSAQYGALLNAAIASGQYSRSALVTSDNIQASMPLFWFSGSITDAPVPLVLPRTDALPYAGVALQRNPSTVNNAVNGLACFVGGGAHVHSHATGMDMELFGEGTVLGCVGGKGDYGSLLQNDYYRLFAAGNAIIVNGYSCGSGGWGGVAINNVQVASMEPQPFQTGVSSNLSFTCTTFADTQGTGAEATEQRTMAIVRTSSTTGYYVDFFRSKSTVTNAVATTLAGNVTNQFHDYIYHNLGDSLVVQTNGVALPLFSQPARFQTDIGDTYQQPGWRYYTKTMVSYPLGQSVWAQFAATNLSATTYMDVYFPAVTNREYATVGAPPVLFAPSPYNGMNVPTLVVRQMGDAWKRPFAVIYEPHHGSSGSGTVQNVTTLEQNGAVVGMEVDSTVGTKNLVQYVLCNDSANGTYTNAALGIGFTGRFAVITDNGNQSGSLYLGDGASLQYQNLKVVSPSGTNTGANVQYAAGQTPVVTANGQVLVTTGSAPALAAITNRTLIAGQTLMITNVATDFNVPPQLVFSLPTAPSGAAINSTNGIFIWRPAIAQSPSTNPVTVQVVDSAAPSLTATQSFKVTVNPPVKPSVTNASLSNGQFKFTVGGSSGPDYIMLASTNLLAWAPLWTNLSPVLPLSFTNATTNFNRRFYRVQLGP